MVWFLDRVLFLRYCGDPRKEATIVMHVLANKEDKLNWHIKRFLWFYKSKQHENSYLTFE